MKILEVNALGKQYGGLVAAKDISFDVENGSITAVIGPNGAGKTTLFNMISGFVTPTGGLVRFEGNDLTGFSPDQIAKLGLVRTFQLVQLFKSLTVLENVEVGSHLRTQGNLGAALLRPGWARQQELDVRKNANAILSSVGLSAHAEDLAGILPYGQQRLLEIARALAAEPKLLLLDEPAAGLDRNETERLAEIIRNVAANGTTVLLIEHDMSLIMDIAQHIVVLDFGRCIASGTPDQIRKDPAVLEAYLGGMEATHV
ncbi:ABC transporter ATP-binding protein [Phyllobacterium sp. SB3]|uniref:ABC transporter ATP-binding protein n=1 Tax=Phyllobacterium sp. SB3 TaxID=3156073 RepID=UPI0032B01D14